MEDRPPPLGAVGGDVPGPLPDGMQRQQRIPDLRQPVFPFAAPMMMRPPMFGGQFMVPQMMPAPMMPMPGFPPNMMQMPMQMPFMYFPQQMMPPPTSEPQGHQPAHSAARSMVVTAALEGNEMSTPTEVLITGPKRVLQCPHCSKIFPSPSKLDRHSRVHTGERPFQCGICFVRFTQKSSLKTHMLRHANRVVPLPDGGAMASTVDDASDAADGTASSSSTSSRLPHVPASRVTVMYPPPTRAMVSGTGYTMGHTGYAAGSDMPPPQLVPHSTWSRDQDGIAGFNQASGMPSRVALPFTSQHEHMYGRRVHPKATAQHGRDGALIPTPRAPHSSMPGSECVPSLHAIRQTGASRGTGATARISHNDEAAAEEDEDACDDEDETTEDDMEERMAEENEDELGEDEDDEDERAEAGGAHVQAQMQARAASKGKANAATAVAAAAAAAAYPSPHPAVLLPAGVAVIPPRRMDDSTALRKPERSASVKSEGTNSQ